MREISRNISTVHKELRKQIQPVMSGERNCTMMLLDNLAYPQWASIDCNAKLLLDSVCVVQKSSHKSANQNTTSGKFHCKQKDSVQFKNTCYTLFWFSGIFSRKKKSEKPHLELVSLKTLTMLEFLFVAVNGQLTPIFTLHHHPEHLFRVTYTKYFSRLFFYAQPIKITGNTTACGFFMEKSKTVEPDISPVFGNVHKCTNEVYISGISVDSGHVDCPADTSDESDSGRKQDKCSPLHHKSLETETKYKCVHFVKTLCPKNFLAIVLFTCKSGKAVSKQFVDDLISDCGADAEDEHFYKSLLLSGIQYKCNISAQIPCVSGHNRCHSVDDICVYKLDEFNILVPCRNGGHMQECQNFTCNAKYKCPSSYCLPFGYVCNGIWDCPNGDDEKIIMCNKKGNCIGMFQCKNSHICIHLREICDNQLDCIQGDDEFLCALHNISCPGFCKCLYFAVACENATKVIGLRIHSPFLSLYIKETPITNPHFLQTWTETIIITLINNSLYTFCDVVSNHPCLTTLNIKHNSLCFLSTDCFCNISKLKLLELSHNQIGVIRTKAFRNLPAVHFLNLSNNNLCDLGNDIFFQVGGLKHVSILSNLFPVYINRKTFLHTKIKLLESNDHHICCTLPEQTLCSVKMPWYASCSRLLPSLSMVVPLSTITAVILLTNMASVGFAAHSIKLSKGKNDKTIFELFSLFINSSDTLCGVYFLILLCFHAHYKDKFFLHENLWQNSWSCLIVFMLSFLFSISSPIYLMLFAISRLMVILYPFDSQFKETSFVKRHLIVSLCVCLTLTLIVGVAYQLVYSAIPTNLCLPLVDPTNTNIIMKILTIFITLSQVIATIVITIAYSSAIWQRQYNKAKISQSKSKSSSSMVVQLLILTLSNISCWIPSGIIYFTSMLLETYPTDMVIWTTIVVLPINSIINPAVFVTLYIKSLWQARADQANQAVPLVPASVPLPAPHVTFLSAPVAP